MTKKAVRNVHKKEHHNLHHSVSIIRLVKSRLRFVRHVALIIEQIILYEILGTKSRGKLHVGIKRWKRANNVRRDIKIMAFGNLDWI